MSTAIAPLHRPSGWGAHADDWATVQEWQARPVYEAVLDELAPWHEATLLDLGCGSGGFSSLAAARAARVAGVDTAPELIDIAERRVASGAFRLGDLARLPYANGSFSVVSGLNSFQYTADPAATLAEAARVTRPGGALVVAVWAPADECDAAGLGLSEAFALSDPGVLEDLFATAGLAAGSPNTVACPWRYRDEETAVRGLVSAGVSTATVREALAPYRSHDGSYLLRNAVRYAVARVG